MAIHPDLPGLEVTVDVGDEDLLEYDDDDEIDHANPPTLVKHVEAVSGAEFGFAFRFDSEVYPFADNSLAIRYFVDGRNEGGLTYQPRQIRQSRRHIIRGTVRGKGNGRVLQAMMFSELSITEDGLPTNLVGSGKLQDLGTFKIKCYKADIERIAPVKQKSRKSKNSKAPAAGVSAMLGASVPCPSSNVPSTTRTVRKGGPLAIFEFRYRSRAALQALRVIPRTSSPVPLEDHPVDELSQEEMRELLLRQKADRAINGEHRVKKEIKRKHDDLVDDSDVEIVEHPRKKTRTSDRHEVEVVDLCFDD
ncbi:hypothetical protein B0A55_05459 [Friedmanniomyces simplex]|uniref:DUF7918 domain-containing protein n=1 Tax=Friedmanniomyces simplex TaxID=329884 RepID=A0A4U0XAN9_9PEZI|nr:hypothetical protein B0A55_05459 [Friedmanniomyces simplex]